MVEFEPIRDLALDPFIIDEVCASHVPVNFD
jgi:hypothetical protein